jgi:hypothetical protein
MHLDSRFQRLPESVVARLPAISVAVNFAPATADRRVP